MELARRNKLSLWSLALFSKLLQILTGLLLLSSAATHAQIPVIEEESVSPPSKSTFAPDSSEKFLAQGDWLEFQTHIQTLTKKQQQEGIAYMVSGSLVLIGATVGLANVDTTLERSVYALSQSLSIGALGYGYYQYKLGSQERSFYQLLASSSTLTNAQKSELIQNYYRIRREQEATNKWIRFYTYLTISGLNLAQAGAEKNNDMRNTLYFIGGVSALAAISIQF